MQDLIKRIGHFVENHVEKIVLVVVGLVCVVLFFKWVIFSPAVVTLDGKKLSAGRIDKEIFEKAKELERRINSTSEGQKATPYKSVLTSRIDANNPAIAGLFDQPLQQGFKGLFHSPLASITIGPPVIHPGRTMATSMRRYKLPPRIGEVTDVAAVHLRAAAWVPLQELTVQNGYDKVNVEANDVDLVTVEAKFNTVELCRQFRAYFAGENVAKAEWRDPCLAEPVFAAVQLQRQELLDTGAWSDWQEIPRSRSETYGELFTVNERVQDLPPGGLEIRMMQMRSPLVRMNLLQPEGYQIASAEEEWFPPSFYSKFKNLQRKVEIEEKREEREKDRGTQSTRDDGRIRPGGAGGAQGGQATGPGGRYRSGSGAGGVGDSMYGGAGGTRDRRGRGGQAQQDAMYGPGYGDQTTRKRGASKSRTRNPDEAAMYGEGMYGPGADLSGKTTTNEVYYDFAQTLINFRTELDKLEKPLLFWAFDDTTQPGHTYKYRIRLGVFNPIAGSNQLAEQSADKKDQAILWSDFSEVTKPVDVRERMYFFAKDVQEPKKSTTVEVARYILGYWRTADFDVKPGEAIGKEMAPPKVEEKKRLPGQGPRITDPAMAAYDPMGMGMPGGSLYGAPDPTKASTPELIDYRTGKVLLDLVQGGDWGEAPNLRPRMYNEMLYTGDGRNIEHMPIGTQNWPKDLVAAYQYVKTEVRREPEAFRQFKKGGIRGRMGAGMGGYEGMGGYDEMMYMQGGPGGPGGGPGGPRR